MIPIRAISLITLLACLLGLVNIGSSTAFNALCSLPLIGHYFSYLLPIVLLVIRRIQGTKEIPFGPWTLGRYGLTINLAAIAYAVVMIVLMVFPPYRQVTAQNMNYSSVIFGGVMLLSVALWVMGGGKRYAGPVRDVLERQEKTRWKD